MAGGPSYGTVDTDYARRLATAPDEDGPVLMVNLMKYRARASYADGTDHGITGREADDRYAPVDVLDAIGARVVFFGDVEHQFLGGEPVWERVGCVQYPRERAFIEMQSRPDFLARHEHKEAGMEATIVMGCVPAPLPERTGALAAVPWSAVPHPPTEDDGPAMIVHVIRFADGARERMEGYYDVAFDLARRHGARVAGWYDVEGTIVGDGRRWDQVRFNLFPSKAAFMAVALDRARQAAQAEHRDTAIADTYTMLVRPLVDRLPGSEAGLR